MEAEGQRKKSRNGIELDRSTLALFVFIALVVVAGAAYGMMDEGERTYTMSDVPPVADGTYNYHAQADIGILDLDFDVILVFAGGEVTSMEVDGDVLTAEEVDEFAQSIFGGVGDAVVDFGPEWTDGVDTVGTYVPLNIGMTQIYSDDGTLLCVDYSPGGYVITMTLDGWEQAEDSAE